MGKRTTVTAKVIRALYRAAADLEDNAALWTELCPCGRRQSAEGRAAHAAARRAIAAIKRAEKQEAAERPTR